MLENLRWDAVLGAQSRELMLSGAWITLQLAFYTIVFSTLIGTLVALGRVTKSRELRPLRQVLFWYTEFVRNVPALVHLAFWYFGIFSLPAMQSVVKAFNGYYTTEFLAGVCALVIYRSAYIAEAMRGGLQSVPRGQYEAAAACGMNYAQIMSRIIMPQALRMSAPSLINHYIGALKGTSIVMVIGVPDLVFEAYSIVSRTFEVFLVMGATAGIYIVFCITLSTVLNLLWQRLDRHWGNGAGSSVSGMRLDPTQEAS